MVPSAWRSWLSPVNFPEASARAPCRGGEPRGADDETATGRPSTWVGVRPVSCAKAPLTSTRIRSWSTSAIALREFRNADQKSPGPLAAGSRQGPRGRRGGRGPSGHAREPTSRPARRRHPNRVMEGPSGSRASPATAAVDTPRRDAATRPSSPSRGLGRPIARRRARVRRSAHVGSHPGGRRRDRTGRRRGDAPGRAALAADRGRRDLHGARTSRSGSGCRGKRRSGWCGSSPRSRAALLDHAA